MSDMQRVTIRCPKCRSLSLELIETSSWTTVWCSNAAGLFDRDARNNDPASIDRFEARCRDCRHGWKPRKADQIDDVCAEVSHV